MNVIDLNSWIEKYKNTVFRMFEYKKIWTPYEMEQKFMDETEFKTDRSTLVKVKEAVTLPNGEVLLKLRDVDDEEDEDDDENLHQAIYYWRNMKDIQLDQFDYDNSIEY